VLFSSDFLCCRHVPSLLLRQLLNSGLPSLWLGDAFPVTLSCSKCWSFVVLRAWLRDNTNDIAKVTNTHYLLFLETYSKRNLMIVKHMTEQQLAKQTENGLDNIKDRDKTLMTSHGLMNTTVSLIVTHQISIPTTRKKYTWPVLYQSICIRDSRLKFNKYFSFTCIL